MNNLFDIETLLAAINIEQPVGSDLRATYLPESRYQQAREQRIQVRQLEKENSYESEVRHSCSPYWQKIASLSEEILKMEAKDLEVCVWLLEAHTRLNGFQGFAASCQLICVFLERYWDEFYPLEDTEDPAARFVAVAGLNGDTHPGTLIAPLYQIAITDTQIASYSLWDYQQALLDKNNDENKATLAEIETAAIASGKIFAKALYQGILSAINHFQALSHFLEEKLDAQIAPPSSKIMEVLHSAQEAVMKLYQSFNLHLEENDPNADAKDSLEMSADEAKEGINYLRVVQSRQQAFQQLQRIADYFRQNEPSSPIPMLLERAIYWGNLPLSSLLTEWLTDQKQIQDIYRLIGVRNE